MLEAVDYKKIFYYFEEISRIPRGSGNISAISDYLVDFAKKRNLSYYQDETKNVIIYKPGTPGREHAPAVILQGHMDMVCEKESGSAHDFTKDPISLVIDGDYICADGTTLGADDGIMVAYGLAILDAEDIAHPPLEVLFTVDEETGMDGAIALDVSKLSGKYLLNIDSEEEGTLLLGAAGGETLSLHFPVERKDCDKKSRFFDVEISGLRGGHSGTEIDKGHENAVCLLARFLMELSHKRVFYGLCDIHGGKKDNVIPSEAVATLGIFPEDVEFFEEKAEELFRIYQEENSLNEPELKFSIKEKIVSAAKMSRLEKESARGLLFFLNQAPNGVQRMNYVFPGVVESSVNLGILELRPSECLVNFSIRSLTTSYKKYIAECFRSFAEYAGAIYEVKGEYPAWEYHGTSEFAGICEETYEEMYGSKPVCTVIHAGLECGILSEKAPELQIVSIGADTLDIHSVKERLSISSAKRVFDYILRILDKVIEVN